MIHFDRMQKAAAVASKYLEGQPHLPPGGYVLLWRMKATGWTCDLNTPRYARPGALAVHKSGAVYVATGGDYWQGAAEWSMLYPVRSRA